MTTVAILYFSGYGHTHTQAEAIAKGVDSTEAKPNLIRINDNGDITDAQWEQLAVANAIIFGCPTYMGGAAWQFKKVADASSKVWFEQGWKNKIAGGFTCSAATNGNKESTLKYLFTLSQQHGQIWVSTGVMPASSKADTNDDINWTGSFEGAMAIARSDANPDEVNTGDIKMAEKYGQRIAEFSAKIS